MSSSLGARSGASWGLALSSRLRLCRGMCLVFSVVVAVVLAVGIGVSEAVYEHVSWGELWGGAGWIFKDQLHRRPKRPPPFLPSSRSRTSRPFPSICL